MQSDRKWTGKWISAPSHFIPDETAPLFRKTFSLSTLPEKAEVFISGVGFYELTLNGRKVGDAELTPAYSAYDREVFYNRYDVAPLLKTGENTVEVLLGCGWFHQNEPDAWEFEHATWRATLQFIMELFGDGELLLCTDRSWQCTASRLVFNSLRLGETYDSTFEMPEWRPAELYHGPGGFLKLQPIDDVRVFEILSPVAVHPGNLYDFGVNLSGNVEITVRGPRGTRVEIAYSELPNPLERRKIDNLVYVDRFQKDCYVLSGEGEETWHSRFGYNGFRYASINAPFPIEILSVKARVLHTDLPSAGKIETDHPFLQKLHEASCRSVLTNFVHMPTDCPHREKNGWTGDSCLSAEQVLFNFDMKKAYGKWLDDIVTSQRPNGAISCIVPTSVWGYNWGTGATWDYVLFELPWQYYRYTGDRDFLTRYAPAMKKYLGFIEDMGEDNLFLDGLGDWCPPDYKKTVSAPPLVTVYAYKMHDTYGKIARILGMDEDAVYSEKRASEIKADYLRHFKEEPDSQAWLALLLYFGLAEDPKAVTARLVEVVEKENFHPTFGIFGNKYIFSALTEQGRFDVAWKLLTVEGYPGFPFMLSYSSGTLTESFNGDSSQNHHMYSDVELFLYKILAGIRPDEKCPGFKHMTIEPHIPASVRHFRAEHQAPGGKLCISWNEETVEIVLPEGSTATLVKKDGSAFEICGSFSYPRKESEYEGL